MFGVIRRNAMARIFVSFQDRANKQKAFHIQVYVEKQSSCMTNKTCFYFTLKISEGPPEGYLSVLSLL